MLDLLDTDAGLTKSFINELGANDRFLQMSFGNRPQVELFDLAKDPDCARSRSCSLVLLLEAQ